MLPAARHRHSSTRRPDRSRGTGLYRFNIDVLFFSGSFGSCGILYHNTICHHYCAVHDGRWCAHGAALTSLSTVLSSCISSCTSKARNKPWSHLLLQSSHNAISSWGNTSFWHICICRLLQGIILSGGQKQRISVARALYQQTNVVFLVSLCDWIVLLMNLSQSVIISIQFH